MKTCQNLWDAAKVFRRWFIILNVENVDVECRCRNVENVYVENKGCKTNKLSFHLKMLDNKLWASTGRS